MEANIFFNDQSRRYNCNIIDQDGDVVHREYFDIGTLYKTVKKDIINMVTRKTNIYPGQ